MTATRSPRAAHAAHAAQPSDVEAPGTAGLLRRGVLVLALLGGLGIGVELAVARHWQQPVQLVAWVFLGLALVATALVAVRPRRASVLAGRVLAAAVAGAGAFGAWVHVSSNYASAASSPASADQWEGLSEVGRWWAAATGQVGPAPSLVPLVLAQVALVVALATLRHPALRTR